MPAYLEDPAHAPFVPAIVAFVGLLETLVVVGARSDDHAHIEQLILKQGTEVLRLLLEICLNMRAASVQADKVEGADGVMRTHHRSGTRQLETLFGTVVVKRDRVGARGAEALVPADASLNMPADRFSFGVRERVVAEAIRGSYDAAGESMDRTSGADLAKRQAEELVVAAAQDFDAFYDGAQRDAPERGSATSLLVLSVDGKGIVMRPDGLRKETRKAASKGFHKIDGRLSRGEKRNRKRMATVAAVYDLEARPRTVDDILGDMRGGVREQRPRAQGKRVWASVEKSAGDVIHEVFDEVHAREPEGQRPIVALVDGNATQIREIRSEARSARSGARPGSVGSRSHWSWTSFMSPSTSGVPLGTSSRKATRKPRSGGTDACGCCWRAAHPSLPQPSGAVPPPGALPSARASTKPQTTSSAMST